MLTRCILQEATQDGGLVLLLGAQGKSMAMSRPRILLIDDEVETGTLLRVGLGAHGYDVSVTTSGEAALEEVARKEPDTIILDLMLPGMSGLDTCRTLREWSKVPVIVVSAMTGERTKIDALDTGADDYVLKPFSVDELAARVRAVLRRAADEPTAVTLHCGELALDQVSRAVTLGGREVRLTPTEYEILKYLMTHAGKVVTYPTLLHAVWGAGYEGANPNLRVFIARLRQKIERDPECPRYIRTESRVGYRLSCDG
jgi:two-component system KDP operon response regulator KdpE